VPTAFKSGNLNLLDPSEAEWAWTGIAFFTITTTIIIIIIIIIINKAINPNPVDYTCLEG
jgi:hypothetical protein